MLSIQMTFLVFFCVILDFIFMASKIKVEIVNLNFGPNYRFAGILMWQAEWRAS